MQVMALVCSSGRGRYSGEGADENRSRDCSIAMFSYVQHTHLHIDINMMVLKYVICRNFTCTNAFLDENPS